MMPIASGMGKPRRNEILAECYLRAAGVAAVWIDADGRVGAQDAAKLDVATDHVVYCRPRRAIRARLSAPIVDAGSAGTTRPGCDRRQAQGACRGRRGRADAALGVRSIDRWPRLPPSRMPSELRPITAIARVRYAFKVARLINPSVRYVDYLEARKAAMLDELAREAT